MPSYSTGADVAIAVTDFLKTQQFDIPIDPEWNYGDWRMELKDLKTLRVDVVPSNTPTLELQNQGRARFDGQIDIAVRRKFDTTEQDECGRLDKHEIATLSRLTEDIAIALLKKRLSDGNQSVWSSVTVEWNPNKDHLQDLRQFTGWVRVTFITTKALP